MDEMPMCTEQERDAGFVHIVLLITILPLMLVAMASQMSITGRGARQQEVVRQERALLAAESGVDDAIARATEGTLKSTPQFKRVLGSNGFLSYKVEATHSVGGSGQDLFALEVVGRYGTTTRRIMAYLGRVPGSPSLDAAIAVLNPNPQIQIDYKGVGFVTGNDTNMDGSAGPNPAVDGLAIAAPATVADLTANMQVDQPLRTTGKTGPPSLGVSSAALDIAQIVNDVKNSANHVLSSSYTGAQFGDGAAADFRILYREGDLQLDDFQGAGILVVTGKLQVAQSFRFDGVLIVLGDIQMDGSAGAVEIHGALIQGPAGNQIQFADAVKISYSSQTIGNAGVLGSSPSQYVAFNGWQEVAR